MVLHRKPRTDAELLRNIDRRLKRLETPRQVKLGQWMLSVSPISGDLVADHIPTGMRRIIAAVNRED